MTYIKLTRADGTTRNGMRWAVGVTNRATGEGNELCTDGVLHVYDTPEQAAFMQQAHVSGYTRAWEVESDDEGITDGTKRGIKTCTVIREITLPELTVEQRVEIAIRASLLVYRDQEYVDWAIAWLSGEDRSSKAAGIADDADDADYAADAAYAAAYAAVGTAYAAAYSAAYSAYKAAYKEEYKSSPLRRLSILRSIAQPHRHSVDGPIDLVSIIQEVLSND